MADYFCRTIVHQAIPQDCLASIERALLTRIFESELQDGEFYFCASEYPETIIEKNEELVDALSVSRSICPELCAAIDGAPSHLYGDQDEIDLDDIGGYSKVLQSIVKRNPHRLPCITVAAAFTCARMRNDGFGGEAILITPDAIERFNTFEWLNQQCAAHGVRIPWIMNANITL